MSENQIPAPIIATQNNANETQRNETQHDTTTNNANEIPRLKPEIYANVKEAIDAGATQIVINRRGAIYKFTPEQFPQLIQRQQQRQQQYTRPNDTDNEYPLPPPPPRPEQQYRRFPGEDAHNANVQLREDLDHAQKMTEHWHKCAMRVGRQSAQDRIARDEAIKRRDDLEEARDTWMKKARESAKEVADLRKEMEELRRSRDYWQTQAEKWHKQNDASVDYVEELKKEKSQLESKFERETNKVQTLEGTLALIRRKVNQAIGEPSN